MMQSNIQWSSAEKQCAEAAIRKAYERETEALIQYVRETAIKVEQTEDVWQLHDFLSARRHDIDGKYDDREPFLLFTLSKLIQTGLLQSSELECLGAEKKAKVTLLSRM